MSRTAAPGSARGRAREIIHPNLKDMYAQYHFPSALVVDGTLHLSGVLAVPRDGEADLVPAYERAFAEIGDTLAQAGMTWDDVVKFNSYHTDLMAEAPAMCTVKDRLVLPPYPAWTAVNVASLADPAAVTEIEIVAVGAKG